MNHIQDQHERAVGQAFIAWFNAKHVAAFAPKPPRNVPTTPKKAIAAGV